MLTFRRHFDDERGVTLILFAILMVALLGIAGLVVNIGLVRADRQRNKGVADVAVTAGMQALNYNGYVGTFRGACTALDYLKANHSELSSLSLNSGWTDGSGTTISGGNPCDSTPTAAYTARYNQICDYTSNTTARASFAWFSATSADGMITVTVKAGYAASDMTSDGFADDAYHTDSGDATKYGCDQLAVTIQEREPAGFGKVVGADTLSSRIRSVGRVEVGGSSQSAIALLLLERTACGAVDINGTGTSVRVLGTGTLPGIVHADSYGNGGSSGNCNSLDVLQGDVANGIVAERAPSGSPAEPGVISTAAMSGSPGISANAYDSTTNVVAQDSSPTGHAPIGRGPVDMSYRAAIAALDADAATKTTWSTATANTSGYRVTNCNPNAADLAFSKLFLNCSNFNATLTFPANVTDVIFNGKISLGSGNVLTFVSPANVYVYGDSSGGNPQGVSLGSGATLSVNQGTDSSCSARTAGTPAATTKFVIANGQLQMSGGPNLRLCSTTLLLGDGSIPTTNGTLPTDNSYNGPLSMTGGATVDWTAPNANNTGRATAAQLANLEDLAFWTESSTSSNINGSGSSLTLKGVFFAPNADPFKINAGSGTITADAQFVVRKLEASGGGVLNMRANPDDVVLVPYVAGFDLVR